MNTVEGNKLISRFASEAKTPYKDTGDFVSYNGLDAEAEYCDYSEMKYHTSWDWLMPVVEKIANHRYEDYETVHDYAFPRTFGMRTEQGMWLVRFNRHALFEEETLIKATWSAVVDWIETFNKEQGAHASVASKAAQSSQRGKNLFNT